MKKMCLSDTWSKNDTLPGHVCLDRRCKLVHRSFCDFMTRCHGSDRSFPSLPTKKDRIRGRRDNDDFFSHSLGERREKPIEIRDARKMRESRPIRTDIVKKWSEHHLKIINSDKDHFLRTKNGADKNSKSEKCMKDPWCRRRKKEEWMKKREIVYLSSSKQFKGLLGDNVTTDADLTPSRALTLPFAGHSYQRKEMAGSTKINRARISSSD